MNVSPLVLDHTLIVRIPKTLQVELEERSRAEDRTVSAEARRALRLGLEIQRNGGVEAATAPTRSPTRPEQEAVRAGP